MNVRDLIEKEYRDHQDAMKKLHSELDWVQTTGEMIAEALLANHKLLIAGNGGSAADSQHVAAEIVGRFSTERRSLPAIALTTDTSALTAIANDYGYHAVFSRQLEGLGSPGDVFIAISTSGNSENLVVALETARKKGMKRIALLGKSGGKMANMADHAFIVPSSITQRIQEVHEWILHTWCAIIDHAVETS